MLCYVFFFFVGMIAGKPRRKKTNQKEHFPGPIFQLRDVLRSYVPGCGQLQFHRNLLWSKRSHSVGRSGCSAFSQGCRVVLWWALLQGV